MTLDGLQAGEVDALAGRNEVSSASCGELTGGNLSDAPVERGPEGVVTSLQNLSTRAYRRGGPRFASVESGAVASACYDEGKLKIRS